jgi:hypothetical protein
VDGQQQPLSEMTRVHWDHDIKDVVRTKVLSTAPGVSEESNNLISPPSFYTLIKNLGESPFTNLLIQFPKYEDGTIEDAEEDPILTFTYEHSERGSDILYMAGIAKPQSTLFIVNATMNSSFPFAPEQLSNNEIVSPQIEELIEKYFSTNSTVEAGFRITQVDVTGFWQEFFVPLLPGQNKIVVMLQVDGVWNFARALINYNFYHLEFIQQGYSSVLKDPQVSFQTYLSDAPASEEVVFKGYQLGNVNASVDSVYHFYIQERDLLDQCSSSPKPNKRTFNYTYEEVTEDVTFFRIGRCNQFMCEITGRDIPTAPPMGVDRSMEILSVKLIGVADQDSSHGETEEIEIEMDVVSAGGRNIKGIAIPVRFFRVEPIGAVDMRKLDLDQSRMEVTYFIFRGEPIQEEPIEGRIEATLNILASFQDQDFRAGNIGGQSIFSLTEDTIESSSLMKLPEVVDIDLVLDSPGKADMSYVVQYRSTETGNVIGRKWIYGVAEICKYWARDIEIRYAWCSHFSILTRLLPAYRKFGLDVDFDALDEQYEERPGTCRRARCGDHEVSALGEGGPSFYPYDSCETPKYFITDVARWVFQDVPDTTGLDEKYRAPDKYTYRTLDHHVFGFLRPDCFMEFSLGTITSFGAYFNGWSRERGPITPFVRPELWYTYLLRGWKLPPLGNRGREAIRIYKTMHYQQYIFHCSNQLCGFCVRFGWLPAIPYASPSDFSVTSSPRTILDQTTNGYPKVRKHGQRRFIFVTLYNQLHKADLISLFSGLEQDFILTYVAESSCGLGRREKKIFKEGMLL